MKTRLIVVLLGVLSLANLSLVDLNQSNYVDFKNENKFGLVLFFKDPCPFCKQIFPELEKTAKILGMLEDAVKIGKFDCSHEESVAECNSIEMLGMRFFENGEIFKYDGGRTAEEIANWISSKVGPKIGNIHSSQEIEELREIVKILVVYFGAEDKQFEIFKKAAKQNVNGIVYVKCESKECMDKYLVSQGNVVLFKDFDEKKNEFIKDNYESIQLATFIKENVKPSIMTFNIFTAKYIFEDQHPGLFLYSEKSNFEFDNHYSKILEDLAPKIKGEIQPVTTDIVSIIETKLANRFGVKQEDLPMLMIHDTTDNITKSYKLEGEFSEQNISKFLKQWKNNELTRYIKSTDVPLNEEHNAVTIVGNSLEQMVNNIDKDLLVMFYAPWCNVCKAIMPMYEGLAQELKQVEGLTIGKFDAHYNEPYNMDLAYYPTIVLWKGSDRSTFIEFKEERNKANLFKFLEEHLDYTLN